MAWPSSTEIQTLLFDARQWTPLRAQQWALDHGFKASQVDQPAEYLRLRQHEPSQYMPDRMRTIDLSGAKGIKAVVGVPKRETGRQHLRSEGAGRSRRNGALSADAVLPGTEARILYDEPLYIIQSRATYGGDRVYWTGAGWHKNMVPAKQFKSKAAAEKAAIKLGLVVGKPKANPGGVGPGSVLVVDKGSASIGIHVRSKLHVVAVKEIDPRTIKVTFTVTGYRAPSGPRSLYASSWKTLERREFNLGKGDGIHKIAVRRVAS